MGETKAYVTVAYSCTGGRHRPLIAGSAAIEAAGARIGIDMANWWAADATFFDLIRHREVMVWIVVNVAGEPVASANTGVKTKTLKVMCRAVSTAPMAYRDRAMGAAMDALRADRLYRAAQHRYRQGPCQGRCGSGRACRARGVPEVEPEEHRLAV
jgi:hypothetical protein